MARYDNVFLQDHTWLNIPRIDLFYANRYSHTAMTNPDFVKLANAMGVHAIRCSTFEELPAKMKEFLEYDNNKPVVMECIVAKQEHVFPMVSLNPPSRFSISIDWCFFLWRRWRLERLYTNTCYILCYKTSKNEGLDRRNGFAYSNYFIYSRVAVKKGAVFFVFLD